MFQLRFLPFVSACLGASTMAACGDANVLATLTDNDAATWVSGGSASGTASSGGSGSGAFTGAGSGSTTGSTSGASAGSGSSGVSGGSGAAGTGGVSGAGDASVGSGGATAGSDGGSGSGGSADAGTDAGPAPTPVHPGNSLTGTLGTLGPAKPIAAALAVHIGKQGVIYLSSAPLTCAQIMTAGWLQSATAGSQVVEIVSSPLSAGVYPIGAAGGALRMGAVNYAAGGTPSTAEVMAQSGTVLVSAIFLGPGDPYTATGLLRGSVVDATFADGSKLAGTFFADFCVGGQHY
jgi:hypothetical protein